MNATRYRRSLAIEITGCGIESNRPIGFNLGRGYQRFEATVGVTDDAPVDTLVRFSVLLDGDPATTRDMSLGDEEDIAVDVSGTLRLELRVEDSAERCGDDIQFEAVWGDARIYR